MIEQIEIANESFNNPGGIFYSCSMGHFLHPIFLPKDKVLCRSIELTL